MRVEAGTSHLYASQRPQAAAASSFSAVLAARQVDFTDMTRQEMRDWVNGEIRSGEMSLDDSRPFMAMTMKIPASGGPGGELPATSDGTRYDFTQRIRDGIQGALSRHDGQSAQMLETAMRTLQRYQV